MRMRSDFENMTDEELLREILRQSRNYASVNQEDIDKAVRDLGRKQILSIIGRQLKESAW